MPELPEVETTRRGIAAHLTGQRIRAVIVRQPKLRWPLPATFSAQLRNQTIHAVSRRAKYLLLRLDHGTLIIHLGMSGSLRLVDPASAPRKHDHVDIVLASGRALRFHDPRRFGAMLLTLQPEQHPLLRNLGPEPWQLQAADLFARSRRRKQAIKSFIMDSRNLVGVGNIYAAEALFLAGLRPTRAAGRISAAGCAALVKAIVKIMDRAIKMGGTTLRDFVSAQGEPGYFRQQLNVYDREGQTCRRCKTPIKRIIINQRSTFFCPQCQR